MTIAVVCLAVALLACAVIARRSERAIAPHVSLLLIALVPPIVGNLIIIVSTTQTAATIGCYMYYIGMDLVGFALLRFSTSYCGIRYKGSIPIAIVNVLLAIDAVQILLNVFFGHTFTTRMIIVDSAPYYALVPLLGQTFHRIIVYGAFLGSVGMFIYKAVTSPRVLLERYAVILLTMVFVGAWQTFFIFSGTPVDQSMIGFGIFGLLIFYFSLYYKPFRLLDRMLARVVSNMNESIFFFDSEKRCIYANDAGFKLVGISDAANLEQTSELLKDRLGVDSIDLSQDWQDSLSTTEEDGKHFWAVEYQTIDDKQNRTVGAFLSVRDRTDEERALLREKHLATHDRLTGLYNKEHFYARSHELITSNPNVAYRVVGIDVKDFKLINDIFSKDFGDLVLCGIADKMRSYATPGELYGRITGDKFGFVIPADEFNPEVTEVHLRNHDFTEIDINYPVVIHMGVYDVTEPDLPVSVMFDRAFMAITSVKNDYQKHVAIYDEHMREDAIWNQKISAELDGAIESGQIRPYLQPMVNSSGKIEGAEVLVRWIHPEEGFLPPVRFIPHFEANGMIAQLDAHMWKCACQILKSWSEHGIDLFLSVNISPKDFYFLDVYQTIKDLVDEYGVDPRRLRLEITETVMMSDLENRLRIIDSLRESGFLVEMDDFGSGYSSLNMLKDIPVDVLKIDMMFLYKTKEQQRAQTILQTIINLSGQLGIPAVTEGVETEEQVNMLVEMGCDMFQGYFFAKPMPVEDFENTYC